MKQIMPRDIPRSSGFTGQADLAREELLAAQATRRAELTHRAERSQLLRQTAGRVKYNII
jgi:hypothetical protein